MKYKLLIVEDDPDIVELLTLYLDNGKFDIYTAAHGEAALEIIRLKEISIALIDIMMPKMNGYELIKNIRKTSDFPIIIISARAMDEDEVLGLNLGADAYIKKPFNPLVVTAQVHAILRRTYMLGASAPAPQKSHRLCVGELEFDTEKLLLRKRGVIVPLTPAELKIIARMMQSPERVFTKAQLYECINGEYYENDDNTMMVHISNLRAKIEDQPVTPQYIKTVRGLGYKIEYKKD